MSKTSKAAVINELQTRENELGSLRDDPRFIALRATVKAEEDRFWARYVDRAQRGRPMDPAEVELKRQWFCGAWDVLNEPHEIEKKLQRELLKHAERSSS